MEKMKIPVISTFYKKIDNIRHDFNSFQEKLLNLINELNKTFSNVEQRVTEMEESLEVIKKAMVKSGVRVRML